MQPFVIESLPDHRGLFQVLSLPQKAEEEKDKIERS